MKISLKSDSNISDPSSAILSSQRSHFSAQSSIVTVDILSCCIVLWNFDFRIFEEGEENVVFLNDSKSGLVRRESIAQGEWLSAVPQCKVTKCPPFHMTYL